MTCYVCPESFTEEQDCIEITAKTPQEALLKAQAISNDVGEQVKVFFPPEWRSRIGEAAGRLGNLIDAEEIVRAN